MLFSRLKAQTFTSPTRVCAPRVSYCTSCVSYCCTSSQAEIDGRWIVLEGLPTDVRGDRRGARVPLHRRRRRWCQSRHNRESAAEERPEGELNLIGL